MDRENARKYRALLDGGRWFFGLSDSRKEALLSAGSVRKIPAGQQVITQGAPANGLFAVLEGAIRISSPLDSGDEALITVVEPPTWLGEISVLDGEPSPLNGIATTDSLLVHVLQSDLDAILERDPAFWRALGALAMGKLRLTFAAMAWSISMSSGFGLYFGKFQSR